MGMLNTSGVAVSGEGKKEKDWWWESGTQCLSTLTVLSEDLKWIWQNVKILLSWYKSVDYFNVILCTFMYTWNMWWKVIIVKLKMHIR